VGNEVVNPKTNNTRKPNAKITKSGKFFNSDDRRTLAFLRSCSSKVPGMKATTQNIGTGEGILEVKEASQLQLNIFQKVQEGGHRWFPILLLCVGLSLMQ